ncbi:MAG: patatin-like phospholipase family protein [Elusimicrobiota bacterium]
MTKFKIGYALGGGGARGFANIGVIKILEENGFFPDIIVGTSMGAIVGALYSIEGSIDKVHTRMRKVLLSDEFDNLKTDTLIRRDEKNIGSSAKKPLKEKIVDFVWKKYLYRVGNKRLSLLGKKELEDIINLLVPDINIEDMPIKYAAAVTNLKTGEPELLSKGSLRTAIVASSAIPGVFPPVYIGDNLYADGGVLSSVPVPEAVEMGANYVIGVDVRSTRHQIAVLNNAYEVLARSNYIATYKLNSMRLEGADSIIAPDVHSIHWANFKKIDFVEEKGREAAQASIQKITASIKRKKLKSLISRIF